MDERGAITPRAANITRSCWRMSSVTRPDTPTQSISEARRYWHGTARAGSGRQHGSSHANAGPDTWIHRHRVTGCKLASTCTGSRTPSSSRTTSSARNGSHGIYVQDGGARERTIARNTVLGNGSDGIRLITAPSVVVIGNQVHNNT